MVDAASFLNLLGGYVVVVLLPLLAFYIGYLIITKAFHQMGFSSWEAIVIVFVSFLLGSGIADGVAGIRFSNIRLFTYNSYWLVGINVGGALIPFILSVYLSIFPLWLVPVVCASLFSVIFYWREKKKAAPLAYTIGTLGVLVGADMFHLFGLLENELHTSGNAVIGGANVFDMVFITGLLAVFLDSLFMYQHKRKKETREQ